MKIKWNRESALVILMAAMILLAMYYYGHKNYVDPIKAEADDLKGTISAQQALLDNYPPSEALLAEYIDKSLSTENFLPSGDQAHAGLVRLEELALENDVQLEGMARSSYQASVEGVPEQFVGNSYEVNVSSESPANFRSLIAALMKEERVWNVTSLTYNGGTGTYTGSFTVEIFYFRGGVMNVMPEADVELEVVE